MTTPLDLVLSRLDGVVQQNGHFMARCPAHDDRNPSLQVTQSDTGAILLRCFAGCETPDILHQINLTYRDLFPAPPARIIRAIDYRIKDRQGNLVATHHRQDFSNGTKNVSWPRGTRPKALPLYGIHERRDDHTTAIVVEGEKARDALDPLTPHNVLVVGTVCGAGATPSLDTLSDLAGLDVVLWPDNDDPGRRHMERIAALLATPPQWIEWPDSPPKGDAADWVQSGATKDDFQDVFTQPQNSNSSAPFLSSGPIVYRAPEERNESPVFDPVSLFRPVADFMQEGDAGVAWIVEPWVYAGGLTMVSGKPKLAGKTTFILHLLAAVLDDAPFLGRPVRSGPVVVISEQGGASLRGAIRRAGLEAHPNLHLTTYRDFTSQHVSWPDLVAAAFRYAAGVDAVLLVVDTLTACASVKDENDPSQARDALDPIAVGADASGVGAIVAFHDKKGASDLGDSQRGSGAYAGGVDIIIRLMRPGNLEPTIRKIEGLSRYEETPDELFIQLTDAGYVSLGGEADIVSMSVRQALVDLLPRTANAALRIDDHKNGSLVIERGIISLLKENDIRTSRYTLDGVLMAGRQAGAFSRSGDGKRHSPFRWWISDETSSFLSSGAPFARTCAPEESNLPHSTHDLRSEETISPGHPDWVWSQPELDETDNR